MSASYFPQLSGIDLVLIDYIKSRFIGSPMYDPSGMFIALGFLGSNYIEDTNFLITGLLNKTSFLNNDDKEIFVNMSIKGELTPSQITECLVPTKKIVQ